MNVLTRPGRESHTARKKREAADILVTAGTTAAALIRYEDMCRAIALCYEVDEVKTIRDQALALQTYAAQARNTEAERQACEIRLRAERRCGQLLRETEKAKRGPDKATGQRSQATTSDKPKLDDLGISRDQSSRWQKLAEIPEDQFEAALIDPAVTPTTTGLIAAHAEPKQSAVDPLALWIWGRLMDCERQGLFGIDPNILVKTMTPHMRQTTLESAPRLAAWLGRILR